MQSNSRVLPFQQPDVLDDPLTEVLRSGARQLLAQAIEMEAQDFLEAMKAMRLADGRTALCVTAMDRSAAFTRALVRCRSRGSRYATGALMRVAQ